MIELEQFESWLENKHCCIIIRRGDGFGECTSCKVQSLIDRFKEHIKENTVKKD